MRQRAAFRKVHGCEVGGTREPQLISKHNRWGDDHTRHSAVFNNFHWCTKCKHHLRESWAVRQNVTFPSFSHALPHECPPYRMSRCVRIWSSLTKDFLMTLSLSRTPSRRHLRLPSLHKNLSAARRLSDWCVGSYHGNVEIRCSKSLKVKAVRGYSGICECIFTKRKIKIIIIKKSQTYKTVHMVDPESSASTSYFKAIRQKETFFWHLNSPLFGSHFVTVFFNIIIVAILP